MPFHPAKFTDELMACFKMVGKEAAQAHAEAGLPPPYEPPRQNR